MKTTLKLCLLACLMPVAALAARTTVADILYTADGRTCSGAMSVSWQTFYTADHRLVAAGSTYVRVTAGILAISLEPASYTARYQLTPSGCVPNQEYWLVPISAVPVSLSVVRSLNPPTPPTLVGLAFLGQGGATTGQCLAWNGSFWAPSSSCGGGGGPGISSLNGQTGSSQTFSNGINVTMSSAGNIHTLGWQGQLSVQNGGTGTASLTGVLKGNSTSAFSPAAAADITTLFSGCSGVLYLGADGACHSLGSASVTSVGQSFTGGLISVSGSPVTSAGTLALSVAGTSGGVPYFSSASSWLSSGVLTANLPVIGGGAGAAPTVGARSGNTTTFATSSGTLTSGNCAKFDASGNIVDNGTICGSGSNAVPPYTTSVVAQTSVSLLAATHGQGTLAVAYCFDSSGTPVAVSCAYTRDGSGNLVFTFSPAFTGVIEVGSGGGTSITGTGTVTNISTTSPITGGPITTTGTIACATCGVTGTGLGQFASTTSAQLATVISDETGTGILVFGTSPTIVTPTIASFANANHDHSNSAGGGNISSTAVASGNKQGNGTKFQMFTGAAPATDDCAKFDVNGNIVTAGAACGSGGGGGGFTALTGDVTASGTGSVAATVVNLPTGVTQAGYLAATAIAAPGTPSAGIGRLYVDSTSKNLAVIDDAGIVKHGVQTKAAVSNSFATAISDAGVVTVAQPTILNLSTFSSANLATQLTDETGTGSVVFGTAPTITLGNGTGLPLTTGVTGVLPIANGGTNGTDAADNGGMVWSNASGYKILAHTTTAGLPLVSGNAATPSWGTRTGNTSQYASWSGAATASRCVHTDASGNLTIAAADCGSGSGGATTALDNLAAVNINISLLAQASVDLGSTLKPFRDLYISGAGTFGTNYFRFTGTPTAARTITVPDTSDTLAVLAAAQTFTNKTLTAPVISSISNVGTITIPTSTDTLVGRATTDTLTNKTLTAPVISTISNSGTVTIPASTTTLVGHNTPNTLTNKTIDTAGGANTLRINGTTINDVEGNTSKVALFAGANPATNDCAKFDLNHNLVTAGTSCGAAAVTLTTVTFSATPTFVRSSQIQEWALTLTGNVTSSTLSGAAAADIFVFSLCQDATGGRTFVPPTGFSTMATPSTTASACTRQTFYWDGANAIPMTSGVSTDPLVRIPPIAFSAVPVCAAGTEGAVQAFNNSTTNTLGSTISNGGAFHVMGYCNGVAWTVMGINGAAALGVTRVCSMLIGSDNGAVTLVDADLGPQSQQCKIPVAATVLEINVNADAGTPSVIVGKQHCAGFTAGVCTAWTNTNLLSGALAAKASNFDACSNTAGTVGIDGGSTCSATLQNTALAAGDWIRLTSGTAGGTAKRVSVEVVYQ